ncbi:MFS transporter [Gloeothece verrucosa]|uniref:Major facilitator superfamily MFS_1 n=1 Tax=Gloeothece verrucosa (strain PCC 7822) TaxID=497965 RepID=E0U8R2_GLOV7|nr:MFS transporter [Gloeothece verrucosa]ADN14926.1 major facilitator superfamily MFS_1 [Gloeothece verrucosa PCC 7822]
MNLAFINVFVALFIFGIVVAFLGAAKLYIADKLSLNDARMAQLFSLNQFSCLIGLVIAGSGFFSTHYKLVLGSGFLMIIVSIWLIGTEPKYLAFALAFSGLGLGGSFLNAGSNALLPVLNHNNPTSITNLAHASYGFGALVLPILFTYLLKNFGWRKALKIIAVILLIPTGAALTAIYPESTTLSGSTKPIVLSGNQTIGLALIASFCHIGIESSLAIWTTTYLKSAGWNEIKASSLVTFFWLALMLGRLFAGTVVTLDNGALVIQVAIVLLMMTLIFMTSLITPWSSILSVFVLGFCCAPIFPTLISIIFAKFDAALSGNIYTLLASVGMGGATIFPYLIGRLSSSLSIYYGLRFLLAPASIMLLVTFFL